MIFFNIRRYYIYELTLRELTYGDVHAGHGFTKWSQLHRNTARCTAHYHLSTNNVNHDWENFTTLHRDQPGWTTQRVVQKQDHFVLQLTSLEVLIRSVTNLAQINVILFLHNLLFILFNLGE